MYRAEDPRPDHICISCYETVALGQAQCGRCGVPLVPLDDPEVLGALRARARAKKERPEKLRGRAVAVAAAVCAIALHAVLLGTGVYDVKPGSGGWRNNGGGLLFLIIFLTWAVFAGAFIYLANALRLFPSPPGADSLDPDTAEAPSLLKFLGIDPARGA
jgi:hypothetical protein